ncbi:hypothetical protein G5Z15_003802 [Escherichia coli]|nr:hypothetical protein [Escherichia coli]
MARLTAAIRDGIIANAIKTKDFAGRDLAIVQKRADFAERLRLFILGEYGLTDARLDEIKAQVDELAKEVKHEGSSYVRVDFSGCVYRLDVNLSGQSRYIYRNGVSNDKRYEPLFNTSVAEYDETKYSPHTSECDFTVRDPKWREELDAIDLEAAQLREEYNTLKSTLRATISAFTTVEKLMEAWPDVKELIPETTPIAKQPGTGIALSVADLNALCGIPTGK